MKIILTAAVAVVVITIIIIVDVAIVIESFVKLIIITEYLKVNFVY